MGRSNPTTEMPDHVFDSSRRSLIILNPVAGKSQVEEVQHAIERRFAALDHSYHFFLTEGEGDEARLIPLLEREPFDQLIVGGGDGTLSMAVTSLFRVSKKIPLLLLPIGTANIIARETGLPLDWRRVVEEWGKERLRARPIDAMCIGDRLFLSHISMGTYSRVAVRTSSEEKRRFGILAYWRQAYREIRKNENWVFTLRTKEKTRNIRGSNLMVANAGTFGFRDFRWGERIAIDDGKVDVVIFQGFTLADYWRLFFTMLRKGRPEPYKTKHLVASSRFEIEAQAPLPLRGDGEIIGERKAEIEVLPGEVTLLVPVIGGKGRRGDG